MLCALYFLCVSWLLLLLLFLMSLFKSYHFHLYVSSFFLVKKKKSEKAESERDDERIHIGMLWVRRLTSNVNNKPKKKHTVHVFTFPFTIVIGHAICFSKLIVNSFLPTLNFDTRSYLSHAGIIFCFSIISIKRNIRCYCVWSFW